MWIVSKGNEGRSGHAGLGLLTSLSTRSSSSAEIKLEYDIDETQTIALLPSTYIDNLRHKRLLCSAFNRQLPLFPRKANHNKIGETYDIRSLLIIYRKLPKISPLNSYSKTPFDKNRPFKYKPPGASEIALESKIIQQSKNYPVTHKFPHLPKNYYCALK